MGFQRPLQRARRYSTYPVLAIITASLLVITANGCNKGHTVSNNDHPHQDKRLILVADDIHLDGATALFRNPTFPRNNLLWSIEDATRFHGKVVLVTDDFSTASRIAAALPNVPTMQMSSAEKQLLLSMMPPVSLCAPAPLDVMTISETGEVKDMRTIRVDTLTWIAAEAEQVDEPERTREW